MSTALAAYGNARDVTVMEKKNTLTNILAISGTVLVWFPILSLILLSVSRLMARRMFRFDYLMPAELFPMALVGGGLLLWATLRARSRWKSIGWGLGIATGFLIGGQALAVATGLASGATDIEFLLTHHEEQRRYCPCPGKTSSRVIRWRGY